jgi:hypothetical protein
VTSGVATLAVLLPPAIFSQPISLAVAGGNPASFSVGADGTAPLGYQWQLNGSDLVDGGEISGSRASSLTLSQATAKDAGSYTVVISNCCGCVTSSVAALTVTMPSPLLLPAATTAPGMINLTWAAVPGQQYQVLYTGDLASGCWTNLGPPITATNNTISSSDIIGPDPQRFYQLFLVQ